jgi:hypothetical protein
MLASTCLAVLFVPPLFVVVQGIEERFKVRRRPARPTVAAQAEHPALGGGD